MFHNITIIKKKKRNPKFHILLSSFLLLFANSSVYYCEVLEPIYFLQFNINQWLSHGLKIYEWHGQEHPLQKSSHTVAWYTVYYHTRGTWNTTIWSLRCATGPSECHHRSVFQKQMNFGRFYKQPFTLDGSRTNQKKKSEGVKKKSRNEVKEKNSERNRENKLGKKSGN